jgi:hypothetical protein
LNRKQQLKRSRRDIQMQRELDNHLKAIQEETVKFASYLYYKDIDKLFTELKISLHDKINAYRLCLVFGFVYDSDLNALRTENEDSPENDMMKMLKDIIPSEKLVFNYVKEEK